MYFISSNTILIKEKVTYYLLLKHKKKITFNHDTMFNKNELSLIFFYHAFISAYEKISNMSISKHIKLIVSVKEEFIRI